MVFIPTYLYIKQHTITGKLYFGKTTSTESGMLKYKGSGTRWNRHINAHGKEHVITLWYQLYDNIFDLVADALSMSKSFDVVVNESWMNLRPENGLDGTTSESITQRNIEYSKSGKHPWSKENISEAHKRKLSEKKKGNKNALGMHHTKESKLGCAKGGIAQRGVKKKTIVCPHCSSVGGQGNMKRYHFDECHLNAASAKYDPLKNSVFVYDTELCINLGRIDRKDIKENQIISFKGTSIAFDKFGNNMGRVPLGDERWKTGEIIKKRH